MQYRGDIGMKREEFDKELEEIRKGEKDGQKGGVKIATSYDHAYKVYMNNVKPYLTLISHFRSGKNKLSVKEIGYLLECPYLFEQVFSKINEVAFYLDKNGKDYMSAKSKLDIVRGVASAPDKAAMLKLQAERFDPFYREEGKDVGSERKINIEVISGRQTDKEISERVGVDASEDIE